MKNSLGFEPILCFARNARQTPEEVFDMLQDRMMTLLGRAYAEHGIGKCLWMPEDKASKQEVATIADWQSSSMILGTEDFDRLGGAVNLSMSDVLGRPRIPARVQEAVLKRIKPETPGLNPVVSFVTLAAFDQIEEMVKQRRAMAETQKETER